MRITALSVSPPTSINSLPFRHLCHVTRTLANQNVSATEPLFGKRSIHELTDDDSHHQSGTLAFHPLFYYLHFSAGAELDPSAVLHSLLPTHPDCRRKLYAPLSGHASAACAFATSPPVRSITLMRPDSDCAMASVRNPDGCTILDVNRLLGDLLPRSLANMRTVLSHYQTLLDDYRAPGGSFPETMNSATHRGFLGDHRYPYLDLSPEDIVPPDAPEVPMGPFIVRCENDHMQLDAVFGVLSHNK
jgi:hypothetical protein